MPKVFFGGLDVMRPEVIEPTKMPRTAAIPVVREPHTGYLNASPYSCGVFSLNPLRILFGPKSACGHIAIRTDGRRSEII